MAFLRCAVAGASLLGLLTAGCAKMRAETVTADAPALVVPAPPPRVISAAEPLREEPPPPPLVPAPPPTEPPAAAAEPPTPVVPVAAAPARPSARKPEAPEAEVLPVEANRAQRDLRPAPSADTVAEERRVADLIGRATKDLARVNYRSLSPEGKAQYDQSKRFADQADLAMRDRNFPYAQTLADKAATLAAGLLNR